MNVYMKTMYTMVVGVVIIWAIMFVIIYQENLKINDCEFNCMHMYLSNPDNFENTNNCICYSEGWFGNTEKRVVSIEKQKPVEVII